MPGTEKLAFVNLDDILVTGNPRIESLHSTVDLKASVKAIGITERVKLWLKKCGDLVMLCGHLRYKVAGEVKVEDPKLFDKLFPEGIPAIIIEGITEAEADALKVDDGIKQALTSSHEVQRCANIYFAQGLSLRKIANRIPTLLDRLSPMSKKPDALKELAEIDADIAEAKADGRNTDKLLAKREKFVGEFRYGMLQNMQNEWRCPYIVEAAMYFMACGVKPAGYEDTYLPKLTQKQVTDLWTAHKGDLVHLDGEKAQIYSKENVGPLFQKEWDKAVKKDKEPKVKGTPKVKSMTRDEILAEVTSGKWLFKGYQLLAKRLAGDKDVDIADIEAYGRIGYEATVLRDKRPDKWALVCQEVKEVEAEIAEAKKAAKGTPPEGPESDENDAEGVTETATDTNEG